MKASIGVWDVSLVDDGTLDTVVLVVMRIQPLIREEVRYSDTSHLRDETGCLTVDGWKELAQDAVDHVAEQRAIRS